MNTLRTGIGFAYGCYMNNIIKKERGFKMKKTNVTAAHEVLVGPPGIFFFASIAVPIIAIMFQFI